VTIMWNYWYQGTVIYNMTDTFFGIVSSIMIIIVWLPQIWTTYKAKSPGSLSVAMLVLTAPGGYLTIVFLAVLYHNSLWVWLPTVFSATFQTMLLILCVYYEYGSKIKNFFFPVVDIRYLPINQTGSNLTGFESGVPDDGRENAIN